MNTRIQLTNKDGDKLNPITTSDEVYVADNVTLTEALEDVDRIQIQPQMTTFFDAKNHISTNLLDVSTVTEGMWHQNNTFIENSSYVYFDQFIPVDAGDVISLQYSVPDGSRYNYANKPTNFSTNLRIVCAFDSNKAVVQSSGGADFTQFYTVPDGISYVKITIPKTIYTQYSQLALVKNATGVIPYEEFGNPSTVYDLKDESNTNHWYGKKWYAFGTSITSTNGRISADSTEPTGKYLPYLAEMSGMYVLDRGKSGGTIGTGGQFGATGEILTRILSTDFSQADLITIEGFVNDFSAAIPIGNLDDTASTSICGALYQAVNYCQQNSNAPVVLITDSTGRGNGSGTDYSYNVKNNIGIYQSDYRKAMIKFAQHAGCYCIDAGSKSEINVNHPEYLTDYLHHSYLGGQQFASVIWSELKNIPLLKSE